MVKLNIIESGDYVIGHCDLCYKRNSCCGVKTHRRHQYAFIQNTTGASLETINYTLKELFPYKSMLVQLNERCSHFIPMYLKVNPSFSTSLLSANALSTTKV